MTHFLANPSRMIALLMAMALPFCCCTLTVVGSQSSDAPALCCCAEASPTDDGCPQEDTLGGKCTCCLKAPSTTVQPVVPTAFHLAPIAHPAEFAVTISTVTSSNRDTRPAIPRVNDASDDPGESARARHSIIVLQV